MTGIDFAETSLRHCGQYVLLRLHGRLSYNVIGKDSGP